MQSAAMYSWCFISTSFPRSQREPGNHPHLHSPFHRMLYTSKYTQTLSLYNGIFLHMNLVWKHFSEVFDANFCGRKWNRKMAFCEHTCKWKDGPINFQYCNESVDGQHPRSKLLRQIHKKYSPERDSTPIWLLTLCIVTNIEAVVYSLASRLHNEK